MHTDARRSGQAMAEFIITLLAMILVVLALVEFLPVFLKSFGMLKSMREEAGIASLSSEAGTSSADRRDEFELGIPEMLMNRNATSGHYTEKLYLPAANLSSVGGEVRIPAIPGTTEKLRYANRSGNAEFVSALADLSPDQALARAAATLTGAGWQLQEIRSSDARILTKGDSAAPSAVAAVHAQNAIDGEGQTVITVIARSAGSSL